MKRSGSDINSKVVKKSFLSTGTPVNQIPFKDKTKLQEVQKHILAGYKSIPVTEISNKNHYQNYFH
jgi:hypothetical protein